MCCVLTRTILQVKISNLMRVLGAEATADPTAIEQEVRRQMEDRMQVQQWSMLVNALGQCAFGQCWLMPNMRRHACMLHFCIAQLVNCHAAHPWLCCLHACDGQHVWSTPPQAHADRNLANKLTPAERREKKIRKMFDKDETGAKHVAVYRVDDLSHPQNRFKVRIVHQKLGDTCAAGRGCRWLCVPAIPVVSSYPTGRWMSTRRRTAFLVCASSRLQWRWWWWRAAPSRTSVMKSSC